MPSLFTEDTFEQAVIQLFEDMGYGHIYAPDMDRDYSSPLLDSILRDSLIRINRGLAMDAIEEAISKLKNFDSGSLVQKNMVFMDYLQNGITVKYYAKGEERSSIVKLVDYNRAENNSFYVVNQFTFLENGNNRRPDIILFINGLPLVLMELKSPSKDEVGAENAQIFGLSSDEVIRFENEGGYDPMEIFNNDQEIRDVLMELINGKYSPEDTEMFRDIYNSLLNNDGGRRADTYFILKDFRSYAEAQRKIDERYRDTNGWAKTVMTNTAKAGKFSSDRTIEEYATEIWKLTKTPVEM